MFFRYFTTTILESPLVFGKSLKGVVFQGLRANTSHFTPCPLIAVMEVSPLVSSYGNVYFMNSLYTKIDEERKCMDGPVIIALFQLDYRYGQKLVISYCCFCVLFVISRNFKG